MDIISQLGGVSQYANKEVFAALGAILTVGVAAFGGYKAVSCLLRFGGAVVSKLSFGGIGALTAAVLIMSGMGGTGLGLGELLCRWTNASKSELQAGLDNGQICAIAEKCQNPQMAKILLEYARSRDGDNKTEDLRILSALVERQTAPDNQDKDGKALTAFIKYLQDKPDSHATPNLKNAIVYNGNSAATLGTIPVAPPVEAKTAANKDSALTIPYALGLMFLGLGATACGVHYRRSQKHA